MSTTLGNYSRTSGLSSVPSLTTYRDILDPGELEAAALAHALGIPLLFSDDRTAQTYIQEETDITVLRLCEVIALGEMRGVYSREEAVTIFDKVNALQDYPVTAPASELLSKAVERIERLMR
jgi:predicted nucleic acid-binding protein